MLAGEVRKQEEIKDIAEQQDNDQFISNYRNEANSNALKEMERRVKMHVDLMTKADEDLFAALSALQKEKEKAEQDFERKQKDLMDSMANVIQQKTVTYDAITMAALANIEEKKKKVEEELRQLDKERAESEEKSAELKVKLSKARFEEAKLAREKQDKDNEEQEKELLQMEIKNQEELLANEQANRAHANESTSALVAQMRSDTQKQVDVGLTTVGINACANDQKNRRHINEKIRRVKDLASACVNTYYGRAYGVLSMDAALMAALTKQKIRQTINSLSQYHETIQQIRVGLDDIDQLLAGMSLKDAEQENVNMENDIRLIKTKISEFAQVIFPLKTKLGIVTKESGIDAALVERFTTLNNDLDGMINKISTIDEGRTKLNNMINTPLPKSSTEGTVKSIQN